VDPLLLTLQLLLGAFGVLGVATAEPTATLEQALRFAAAFAVTVLVARVPARVVVRFAPALYVVALASLVLVLVAGVAPDTGNAQRWLPLGPVTFQPSELMKVAVIAYLAAFFHNHLGDWQIWRPMLVVGIAAGLILAQPNVSTGLFLFVLAFAIMVAAGTSLQRLIAIGTAAAFIAAAIGAPYLSRLGYLGDRLRGFAAARAGDTDITPAMEQANRARQALTRAGVFGVGPSRPRWVPEADTDLIAVSIAQALGLIGVAVLVVAFVLLVARTFRIAGAARGPGALLAAGAGLYVAGQASLNLLVAAGLLPVTGVPLPLVSYGVNSMFSVAVALGFVHAAYREARARGAPL
jgi:cell division protein FtsW